MAVFSATNYAITLNSVDMSAYITSAELNFEVEELGTTAFGSTWDTKIGGLKHGSVSLTFNQDFASTTVDDRLWALIGTVVALKINPVGTTDAATNPGYTTTVLVTGYSPINAKVGDLASFSVTWPLASAVTRDVTP